MFHIENENTDSPTVDFSTGLATVSCDVCSLSKAGFNLRLAARFVGGGFALDSNTFGCSCGCTSLYPLRGADSMSQILTRLAGF